MSIISPKKLYYYCWHKAHMLTVCTWLINLTDAVFRVVPDYKSPLSSEEENELLDNYEYNGFIGVFESPYKKPGLRSILRKTAHYLHASDRQRGIYGAYEDGSDTQSRLFLWLPTTHNGKSNRSCSYGRHSYFWGFGMKIRLNRPKNKTYKNKNNIKSIKNMK